MGYSVANPDDKSLCIDGIEKCIVLKAMSLMIGLLV